MLPTEQPNQQPNLKDGSIYTVSGFTGSGKTTYVRLMLTKLRESGKPCYISDIDGEYRDFYNAPYIPPKEFFKRFYNKTNSIIVFEEAALTFKHYGDSDEMLELIICARRRKNIVVFNFHALRQIPIWILIYVNWVIIKKTTTDSVDRFEKDYPNIARAYNEVRNSVNKYETREINLRAPVV